ncbi:MAG: hypothetical protein WC551_02575 [Patescibacteria group bacterium]
MFNTLLELLDGKKTVIVAILGALVVWVSKEGWVDLYTAEMFMAVIGILGGSASYATKKWTKSSTQSQA